MILLVRILLVDAYSVGPEDPFPVVSSEIPKREIQTLSDLDARSIA